MDANDIIEALGGTAAVARLCQVKQPSVSEWKRNGIPPAREQFLRVLRPDIFRAEKHSPGHRSGAAEGDAAPAAEAVLSDKAA